MKRREFLKLSLFSLSSLALARDFETFSKDKTLIIYYSRSLNTEFLAHFIALQTGFRAVRLETQQPYPKDYNQMVARASFEKDTDFNPALKPLNADIKDFDTLLIAAPIWAMSLCAPMKSFFTNNDLSGKIIVPLFTNAGFGGAKNALEVMKTRALEAQFLDEFVLSFKLYEKIKPDLKAYNAQKIAQNQSLISIKDEKALKIWLEASF